MIRKTTLTVLLLVLLSSVFATGAVGVSGSTSIEVGDRLRVSLAGETRFVFSPAVNSVYAAYLFPVNGEAPAVSARLYRGDTLIAHGGPMRLFEASLSAGVEYTLVFSGGGEGILEIMRATRGRSFDKPIELDPSQGVYEKLLVRAGDAHWYVFTALADGPATIHAEPGEGPAERAPALRGIVIDETGATLWEAAGQADGFAIDGTLEAGKRYFVRISADNGTVGAYALGVEQDARRAETPKAVTLSAEALSLEAGETHALEATISPVDAHPFVTFSSSNPAVVTVRQTGEVRARAAGVAVITARAWGGASAACTVTVARVPLSGIGFSQSELTLRVGESVGAALAFYPSDASDRRVTYFITGSGVASVSRDGVVTGLSEGTARLVAVAKDGGHTDLLEITVEAAAPKLRALLIGQQMYLKSVNKVRVGSINTAQSMASMLESQLLDDERYQTTILLDSTRSETMLAIRETFSEAAANDISLFYITCHGYYAHGMSFFQLYDGSVIAAQDLERELRKIPGTVVVVADCCGSGGLIGEASTPEDFNRGIVRVFSGRVGAATFASSKYKVIASASLDQDSYRISFDENITESDMATVLAQALCDGAGWSVGRSRRSAQRADLDYDGQITLNEISLYVSRRVTWYLNTARRLTNAANAYVQNVQVYPQGDPFVLFGR